MNPRIWILLLLLMMMMIVCLRAGLFHMHVYIYIHLVCMYAGGPRSTHVEVRGQLAGMGFLLSASGSL